MRGFTLLTLLALFVAGACAQIGAGYATHNAIPWRTYKKGNHDRFQAPRTVIIQNGATWQTYWQSVTGEATTAAPKDVDFTSETVVGISLGLRRTGGYEVYVESVRQVSPYDVLVSYVEATPPDGQAVTQALTTPWVMVRMPRVPGQVFFSKRTVKGRAGIDWGEGSCHCCCYCNHGGSEWQVLGYFISGTPGFTGNPFDPLQNIQWRTYKQGNDSRFERFETNVMDNEASWQTYWARNTGNAPQSAPKGIDWVKQRLMAINTGKLGAGASVYVESIVRKNAANLEVTYVVSQQGRDGGTGEKGENRESGESRPEPFSPFSRHSQLSQASSPYVVIAIDRIAGIPTYKRKDLTLPPAGRRAKCNCHCGMCRWEG